METPEFFKNIDWSILREQKRTLLETIEAEKGGFDEMLTNLQGILGLIDYLQDYAVDVLGVNENIVFDMEVEDNRDKETPQELFAREMADIIYDLVINGGSLYDVLPDEITDEFIDGIFDDQFHADIMKGDLRESILNHVLNYPEDFCTDLDGKFCYDYTLIDRFSGIIDKYIEQQFYKDKTKELYICQYCFSDNVEYKMWVNANTKELSTEVETYDDDEECWCNDCQKHGMLIKVEMPYLNKLIGFSVRDNYDNVHPKLISRNHICNLSQANEMIDDVDKDGNTKWKIITAWSGAIENPEPIFDGDPRS